MTTTGRRTVDALTRDPLMTALLVTLACGLVASWSHLARTFALFYSGPLAPLLGGIAATAVDGTLYILALTLGDLARRGASAARVYGGVVALLAVSAAFNADADLTALGGARPTLATLGDVDPLDVGRVLIGAATLPLVVAYLTHGYATLAQARRVADGTATAADRTRLASTPERDARRGALIAHALDHPAATFAELGEAAGVSRQTAANWSRELEAAGVLTRNGRGWSAGS